MKAPAPFAALVFLTSAVTFAQSPGHRLPAGPEVPPRDRDVDVQHVDLVLRFDMDAQTIAGRMTARMVPLRSLTALVLDAAGLEVSAVRIDGRAAAFTTEPRVLKIDAPFARESAPPNFLLTIVVLTTILGSWVSDSDAS